MLRLLALLLAVGFLVVSAPLLSAAASPGGATSSKQHAAKQAKHGKRHKSAARRHARYGRYGFLPGYRPPEVIERERAYWAGYYDGLYGPYYTVPWPRFYRGRWNGGGFGPCYTQTPIGPIWNCGR